MDTPKNEDFVTRRGVFLGALVGLPAATLATLLATSPAQAGGGRDPGESDDECKGSDCDDD